MIIKVPAEIRSIKDKFLDRLEEVDLKNKENSNYQGAYNKIDEDYQSLRNQFPDIQPLINQLDSDIGSLVCRVQEFYYLQGLKDGMELKELMNRGIE